MITQQNYYTNLPAIPSSVFTGELKTTRKLIDNATDYGKSWDLVNSNPALLEVFKLYLKSLNEEYSLAKKSATKKTPAKKSPSQKRIPSVRKPSVSTQRKIDISHATKVELVDLELKIIRRYVNMHGKEKSQNQIRLFLNSLQKAIIEKRIRKTSAFAKEIQEVQEGLIKLFEALKTNQSLTVSINEKKLANYYKLLGKQIELLSVRFIKSYVNLQGKLIVNQQAINLHDKIVRAFNSNRLTKKDRYWPEIEKIVDNLKSFVQKNKKEGILSVREKELNGLNGILGECACSELNGFEESPKNVIMRSTDFVKLKFDKLGFQGKWLNFIGNPSRGFKAMIFGLPKMGKSYLMVEFAGYLARNHGPVLYVAKEEALDDTLQEKLRDKDVEHPDLYVSDYLPEDLSDFEFVFLDSVTKLRLTPQDLEDLSRKYPTISFIYIFQTTKHGEFRGSNQFQHDVDVVIEVPEKGKAIQYGRFNQGGEMDIFNNQHGSVA